MELHRHMQLWVSLFTFLNKEINLIKLSGICTTMKTADITRQKTVASGVKPLSTWALFFDIYRREGIMGINKGVNAVALRQMTNWGSRYVSNRFSMDFCQLLK